MYADVSICPCAILSLDRVHQGRIVDSRGMHFQNEFNGRCDFFSACTMSLKVHVKSIFSDFCVLWHRRSRGTSRDTKKKWRETFWNYVTGKKTQQNANAIRTNESSTARVRKQDGNANAIRTNASSSARVRKEDGNGGVKFARGATRATAVPSSKPNQKKNKKGNLTKNQKYHRYYS